MSSIVGNVPLDTGLPIRNISLVNIPVFFFIIAIMFEKFSFGGFHR